MGVSGNLKVRESCPKGRSEWGDLQNLGCLSDPLSLREIGFPERLLGAPKEARTRHQEHFLQLLAHQFAKPVGSPGVELGALGRSQTSPSPPCPAPTLAHAGKPTDRGSDVLIPV